MENLYNIFPTPIYAVDAPIDEYLNIKKDIDSKLELIQSNLFSVSENFKTSFLNGQDNYFLENYDLHFLKRFICEHVEKYYSLSKFYVERAFIVSSSWINFLGKGGFLNSHVSSLIDVSGIFYFDVNDSGKLVFETPNGYVKMNYFPYSYDDQYNEDVYFQPKNGRLIIFPSWLSRREEINNSENNRVSISFNIKFV